MHVRIVKVWRLSKSNRRSLLQSRLLTNAEASEGLGVQAQTKFEAEDSAAALEFTDALSTSPTSIFQEQQFGNVTVPDVDLVPISDSISWIPIVLGAAAGLAGRLNFEFISVLLTFFTSHIARKSNVGLRNQYNVYKYDDCSVHGWHFSAFEEASFLVSPCLHSRGGGDAEYFPE